MKLHIVSDLHLESCPFELPAVQADILVLAGDIANGLNSVQYALEHAHKYHHVLLIPGNHEFYGHNICTTVNLMKQMVENSNVTILDNDTVVLGDHAFIGSTLWSDFKLYSEDLGIIRKCMEAASLSINDFSSVRYGQTMFNTSHCASLSLVAQSYINQKLNQYADKKKVVITHHTPSMKSVPQKYHGDIVNAYFSSNLDTLVEKSDLWIHGHTHSSFDYHINNARVVCNPRGYTKHIHKQENIEFNPSLVVEI